MLRSLLFYFIWLGGWTAGVAVIQYLVLQGQNWFLLIFLCTHGGIAFVTLGSIAEELRASAERSVRGPRLELTHDAVHATWTMGNGNGVIGVLGLVLVLLVHAGLYGSVLAGMATGPMFAQVLGVALLAVWTKTFVSTLGAVGCHFRLGRGVSLEANTDSVRIVIDRWLSPQVVELPMVGLQIETRYDDGAVLQSGSDEVPLRMTMDPDALRLLDLLRTMSKRATRAENRPVPAALKKIRES